MGYGFDWASSGLGLVFKGLGWARLRIFEPMTKTGLRLNKSEQTCHVGTFVSFMPTLAR